MSITMKLSSVEQDAWPVKLFRHSVEKGWEMVDDDIDSDEPVMATPCAGGIEIRKFRVRIRLFPKDANDTDWNYGYASRRIDRIYCPSRSSSGGLVLKFRNKEECIGFFDRLVALNPLESNRLSTEKLNKDGDQNGTEKSKRKGLDLSLYADDVSVKRRKFDTMSYIVRLLHDEAFQKFVDDIEQTLLSSQDGAGILAAIKRTGPLSENLQAANDE
jgi:hypothetical protein